MAGGLAPAAEDEPEPCGGGEGQAGCEASQARDAQEEAVEASELLNAQPVRPLQFGCLGFHRGCRRFCDFVEHAERKRLLRL